jgi:hypothetical protein
MSRKLDRDELLKRLRAHLLANFKFNRERANARWNAGQSAMMTEWDNRDEDVYNGLS